MRFDSFSNMFFAVALFPLALAQQATTETTTNVTTESDQQNVPMTQLPIVEDNWFDKMRFDDDRLGTLQRGIVSLADANNDGAVTRDELIASVEDAQQKHLFPASANVTAFAQTLMGDKEQVTGDDIGAVIKSLLQAVNTTMADAFVSHNASSSASNDLSIKAMAFQAIHAAKQQKCNLTAEEEAKEELSWATIAKAALARDMDVLMRCPSEPTTTTTDVALSKRSSVYLQRRDFISIIFITVAVLFGLVAFAIFGGIYLVIWIVVKIIELFFGIIGGIFHVLQSIF